MSLVVAPRRRGLVFALLVCMVAALGGLVGTTAATAISPTAPVTMVITSVTGVQAPAGTPSGSVPFALVKAGDSFSVTVAFFDSSSNPASFNNDTKLKITSTAGTLSPSTGVASARATTAQITTSLATAANQVGLTVTVANGPAKGLTTGLPKDAQRFDVLSQLRFENSSTNFQQGIGGDSNCANATKAAPLCGIVVLPDGAASSQVLLSLGACDTTYAKCGSPSGSIVQTLFDDGGLYSESNPATLILKCDKSLCGGGPIQGVPVHFSFSGNDPLGTAFACPAKNTVGAGQGACVDFVQSKRDGAGDTHLYVLFAHDIRVGAS